MGNIAVVAIFVEKYLFLEKNQKENITKEDVEEEREGEGGGGKVEGKEMEKNMRGE